MEEANETFDTNMFRAAGSCPCSDALYEVHAAALVHCVKQGRMLKRIPQEDPKRYFNDAIQIYLLLNHGLHVARPMLQLTLIRFESQVTNSRSANEDYRLAVISEILRGLSCPAEMASSA